MRESRKVIRRKKDAQTELEILVTLFPDIKTRTASAITGRSFSLVSKNMSRVKKKVQTDSKKEKEEGNVDVEAFIHVLSHFTSAVKIPFILNTSVNFVYDTLGKKGSSFQYVTCPKGHVYVAKSEYDGECPVCLSTSIPKDATVHSSDEFTAHSGSYRSRFAELLTEASMIILSYYKARERKDIVFKYIRAFRDVLAWLKFGNITVGSFDVPFVVGCELLNINPYFLRDKFYTKILRKEERLAEKNKKERIAYLDNIDDVYVFVQHYVNTYESRGGLGKGKTIAYRPLRDSIAFFTALQPQP